MPGTDPTELSTTTADAITTDTAETLSESEQAEVSASPVNAATSSVDTDFTSQFAGHIEGFQPRPQQQAMAAAIKELLATDRTEQNTLIIEAGTGVGKTFAYLAPVLSAGGHVILSTGSKTLQDQLYFKDLPLVRKALGCLLYTSPSPRDS